jgi:hypothetical protein
MKPGSFDIFKGSAAAKFSFLAPRAKDNDWMDKAGAILVEAAKVVGTDGENKLYDWKDGKISIALGTADLCHLLENPETTKIVHEYQGTTKSISFKESTDERYAGTWLMSIRQTDADRTSRMITVSLSGGEFSALGILIRTALPKMLGW